MKKNKETLTIHHYHIIISWNKIDLKQAPSALRKNIGILGYRGFTREFEERARGTCDIWHLGARAARAVPGRNLTGAVSIESRKILSIDGGIINKYFNPQFYKIYGWLAKSIQNTRAFDFSMKLCLSNFRLSSTCLIKVFVFLPRLVHLSSWNMSCFVIHWLSARTRWAV